MSELSREEYEELEVKVKALEERVGRLEKDVNSVVEEIRSVLIDVRSTLSELDNPLNYIKELGISDLIESITEDKLKEIIEAKLRELKKEMKGKLPVKEGRQVEGIKEGKEYNEKVSSKNSHEQLDKETPKIKKIKEVSPPTRETLVQERGLPFSGETSFSTTAYDNILKLVTCAGCLTYIFGKKGVEKVLDEYSRREWISHDLKLSLLHVVSLLNLSEVPEEREVSIEDHLIGLYLLNKLRSEAPATEFITILLLLSKYAGFPFIVRIMSQGREKP